MKNNSEISQQKLKVKVHPHKKILLETNNPTKYYTSQNVLIYKDIKYNNKYQLPHYMTPKKTIIQRTQNQKSNYPSTSTNINITINTPSAPHLIRSVTPNPQKKINREIINCSSSKRALLKNQRSLTPIHINPLSGESRKNKKSISSVQSVPLGNFSVNSRDRERNITLAAKNLMIHAAKNLISRDFYIKISENYGIKYNIDSKTDDNGNITKNIRIDTTDIRFAERRNILCEFFSKDREYILENVMLNTILYLNLPFRNPKLSFTENHFYICLIYNTLMFALAGYINDPDDIASAAEGIGLFSRGFLHLSNETSLIENTFSEYKFSSPKDMIAMIKF